MNVLKALAVVVALATTYATHLWRRGREQRGGKVTSNDWILMDVVLGLLFLGLVYVFSRQE